MNIILSFIRKRKILSFILGSILCGLLLVPTSTYANLIVSSIVSQIDTAKLYVSFREPDFTFVGLYGEEVVVRPSRSPYGLVLNEVRITPLVSDIFSGKLTLKVSGKWLQGDFLLHWSPLSDEVSVKVADAALHSFPFFAGLGFTKGTLSSEVVGVVFEKNGRVKQVGGFTVQLSEVTKPRASEIPGSLVSLPFPLKLPAMKNTSLQLEGSGSTSKVEVSSAKLKSSLGKLSGSATFLNKIPQSIKVALDGILTDDGFELLGDPVKLFSSGKVTRPNQPFSINVSGPLKPMPTFKISPVASSQDGKEPPEAGQNG